MSRDGITAEQSAAAPSSGPEAVTEMVGDKKTDAEELRRGMTVGRYVVLSKLGQGGMGVVYSAYDPELDRKVAVKVLRHKNKDGTDDLIARTRFLREAQSMAKLQHPNVAAVYDVGAVGDDIFIAMEFIEGVTLRKHLGEDDVQWRDVVPIFVQAGQGLIAAHAAGIIHRDFKPENVMVDQSGRAVVLDFGLARPRSDYNSKDTVPSEESHASAEVMLTTTGTVMGTPHYMAPEQHRGQAVDERTDQFAFCVALYELLYGRRPFGGRNAKVLAINVVNGRLRTPPNSNVPGRIQRAVLRGLSTDPDERHPSMHALLGQLKSRRRRIGGLAIAGIALATGIVAATSGAIIGRGPRPCAAADAPLEASWNKERRAAVATAFAPHTKADGEATAKRATELLDAYAKTWSAARIEACEAARVHGQQSEEVLEQRYACLDRAQRRFDAVVQVFEGADADVVFGAVRVAHDLPPLDDCADLEGLRRVVPPPDNQADRAEVASIRERLAVLTITADAGSLESARAEADALAARAQVVDYPPVRAEVALQRAKIAQFIGELDTAEKSSEEALLLALEHGHLTALFESLLARAALEGNYRNRFDEAHVYLRRAAAVAERLGGDAQRQASLDVVTARILVSEGRNEEAAERFEAALAVAKEAGTEDAPGALHTLSSYGMALIKLDRHDEASEVLDRAIAMSRASLGDQHPEVATALLYRARVMSVRREYEDALAAIREARDIIFKTVGEQHTNAASALNAEAIVLDNMGRSEEAAEVLRRAIPIFRTHYGEHLNLATMLRNLGGTYLRMGEAVQAVEPIKEALGIQAKALGKSSEQVAYSNDLLGESYVALGQLDEAEAALQRSRTILVGVKGVDHPSVGRPMAGLGEVALARGDLKAAQKRFTRVRDIISPKDEDHAVERARATFGLAQVLWKRGQHDQAKRLAGLAEKAYADARYEHARLAAVRAWLESPE